MGAPELTKPHPADSTAKRRRGGQPFEQGPQPAPGEKIVQTGAVSAARKSFKELSVMFMLGV